MRQTRTSAKQGKSSLIRRLLGHFRSGLRQRTLGAPGHSAVAAGLPDFGFSAKEKRYLNPVEITRGGMGAIYSVLDADLQRTTAMKVALPAILRNTENAVHFVNEARITARLEHPNIVPVHDIGLTLDNGLFFTMKLVAGEPLDEILDKLASSNPEYVRRFGLHELLVIFRKVCDGISFAHSRNIVHLDIKPENIMVGRYGEVQVMDWGIAKYLREEFSDGHLTEVARREGLELAMRRGEIRGTPAYMSPEQAVGRIDQIDEQTDVFLLGASLYHILALHPPYQGDETDEILRAAASARISPLDSKPFAGQVPDALRSIVAKALALKKADRYATVSELTDEIDHFMSGRILTEQRVFEVGDELMRTGEHGREAYVLTQGSVDVFRETAEGRVHLTTLGVGDVVGEMAIISREGRSATVVAREPTQVQVITEDLMHNGLRRMPPWLERAVNALADRLRHIDDCIHPLLVGDCVYHVLTQLLLLKPTAGIGRFVDGVATTDFPVLKLVPRIALQLGLPTARVQQTLEVLGDTPLAERLPSGELRVGDIARLRRFVAYCEQRLAFRPPEAQTAPSLRVDAVEQALFRELHARFAKLERR